MRFKSAVVLTSRSLVLSTWCYLVFRLLAYGEILGRYKGHKQWFAYSDDHAAFATYAASLLFLGPIFALAFYKTILSIKADVSRYKEGKARFGHKRIFLIVINFLVCFPTIYIENVGLVVILLTSALIIDTLLICMWPGVLGDRFDEAVEQTRIRAKKTV